MPWIILVSLLLLIFPSDLPAPTAKRFRHFRIGDEILPYFTDVGGIDLFTPESLKGKTVLFLFARAEQEFSQQALRDVQKLWDTFRDDDFKAVAIVASATGNEAVQTLIDKHGLTFLVLYDEGDILTARMRILVYPTTLVMDGDGRFAYYFPLYESAYGEVLSAKLSEIIKGKKEAFLKEEMKKQRQREGSQKAREEIEKGDVKSGISILIGLLEEGNDSYDVHTLLGYSFISLSEPRRALAHFKTAKKIQLNAPMADLGIGIAYSRKGDLENAAMVLRKVIQEHPGSVLAARELARIFESEGEVEKAIYYLKKELEGLTRDEGG
jgi:tetratricopeptide (TPR) repeat protein